MYGFSIDSDHPGWLKLCFLNKATKDGGQIQTWPVRVLPGAYQLNNAEVPGVTELCNAFKAQYSTRLAEQGGGRTPAVRMPARTPLAGGRTPAAGGRTPAMGYGGRTPMRPPPGPGYGPPPGAGGPPGGYGGPPGGPSGYGSGGGYTPGGYGYGGGGRGGGMAARGNGGY